MRLYRFFEEKCYADMFAAGSIRFTELLNFASSKTDVRFDDQERFGRSLVNSIKHTNYIANDIYSLSFSCKKISKFGSHCIYIDDIEGLVEAIKFGLKRDEISSFPNVDHGPVSYNKDHSSSCPPSYRESILQKPYSYAEENEYRIFFVGKNNYCDIKSNEFIYVNIEQPSKLIFIP